MRVWPDRAGNYWHWMPPTQICAWLAVLVGWSPDQTMSAPLGVLLEVCAIKAKASAGDG